MFSMRYKRSRRRSNSNPRQLQHRQAMLFLVRLVSGCLQFLMGEDPQHKVLIFTSQMDPFFGQERCLEAVESPTPIKVGQPEVDRAAL